MRVTGGIECLCAGLIMHSTECAHITKDLLSLVGELLQSGNSAQPFSLPSTRKMWPSSASVGRFKQQRTLYGCLSPSAYKAASVSGGWEDRDTNVAVRTLPLTGPCFTVLSFSFSNFFPPGTATVMFPSNCKVNLKRTFKMSPKRKKKENVN